MQNLLKKGPLLNGSGNLVEAGYATSLVKEYKRTAIKAKKSRIKEWDYYYIGNEFNGVCLTVADNSYMSMASITFIDFTKNKEITKSKIKLFSNGKLKMPSSSVKGDVIYKSSNCEITFKHLGDKRRIQASMKNFDGKKALRCDIFLRETNDDSMVIATPFDKPGHFFYNQKINLLEASGYVKVGDVIYDFNKNAYGVLDWGRGVWTYKNTWLWSSLSSIDHGKRIGFNLGYGFGDTSAATENMFFYKDKSYKLDKVRIDIPIDKTGKDDYMKPWTFRSPDGSIDMTFTPVLNRHANLNIGVLKSVQNQVFGRFNGSITVNDERFYINDLLGFAEKVTNHW